MKKIVLPPLLSEVKDGEIIWKKINSIDFDEIGHLLCCHLIIEHYLEEYIKSKSDKKFNWDKAKLSFNQKLSLLAADGISNNVDFIPAIKHLNILRNKLSHNLDVKLTFDDFLPLMKFIHSNISEEVQMNKINILNTFTGFVCAWIASKLAFLANPLISDEDVRRQFEEWIMQHSGVTSREILKRHPDGQT